MPFQTNPTQEDARVAQGIQSLAAGLFGNPAQQAQREVALSEAGRMQANERRDQREFASQEKAANAAALGDPRAAIASAIGAGDAKNAGDVLAATLLSGQNASEDARRRAMLAQGETLGPDFAGTTSRADDVSGRNAAESRRETFGEQKLQNQGKLAVEDRQQQGQNTRERIPTTAEGVVALNAAGERNDQGALSIEDFMFRENGEVRPDGSVVPSGTDQAAGLGQLDDGGENGLSAADAFRMRFGNDGSGSGGGVDSEPEPLSDTQKRQWASDADEALNKLVKDSGYSPSDLPGETREKVVNYVVREGPKRPNANPIGLAQEAYRELGISEQMTEDNLGPWNTFGLRAENPNALQTRSEPSAADIVGGSGSSGQRGSRGPSPPQTGGDSIPTVSSPEEARQLPSGTKFKDPDGNIRVVP